MPIPKKHNLGPKTVDCVNLGYAKNSVGYRFLVVKSEVPDQKIGTIMESKDATFFEDIFPMRDMQSTSKQESEETPEPAIPMEYYAVRKKPATTALNTMHLLAHITIKEARYKRAYAM